MKGCYPRKPGTSEDSLIPVPLPVILPAPYFAPPDTLPLDLKTATQIPNGNRGIPILNFTVPAGYTAYLMGYAVATNYAGQAPGSPAGFSFIPSLNGARIWQWQGDPLNNFAITPFYGTGLNNDNLSYPGAPVVAQSGQPLVFTGSNTSGGLLNMAVRVVGYLRLGAPVKLPGAGG